MFKTKEKFKGVRCPTVWSASAICDWPLAEEHEPHKWRPARQCGFGGWRTFRQRLRIAWRVLMGRYDALDWGEGSGEASPFDRRYKDHSAPEFFSATRVYEPRAEGMKK